MAVGLLAVLLVAAVPVALLAGVILTLLGHVVGGFALFGASVLAAVVAVAVAGMSGLRHVRKLISGAGVRFGQLDPRFDVPGSSDQDYGNVVHLDRSEYTEVR
jgi:hypothetical protein